MSASVEYTRDLGDGRVQVFSRSTLGHPFSVAVGRDKLGTADLYQVLDVRAASVDREAAAQAAHRERGVD